MTVCCFLWDGEPADRQARYTAAHVNALRRMVDPNLEMPHDFVCVTDDPDQPFDDGIRTVKLPESGWGKRYPKLWLYSPDARAIGHRILYLDLDCVIVDDLSPLVDRPEDIVLWQEPGGSCAYNTSMVLLTAGTRIAPWATYEPSDARRRTQRMVGTDQAWVSVVLGPDEATWGPADGVLSYKKHCRRKGLPEDARIVFFHGSPKPWNVEGWPLETWAA